jgi:hypothetical protein
MSSCNCTGQCRKTGKCSSGVEYTTPQTNPLNRDEVEEIFWKQIYKEYPSIALYQFREIVEIIEAKVRGEK